MWYWIESESCSVVCDSLQPHGLYSPQNSPGQNTGVGSCSLLQRIFPTQGSNPGLPQCGQILYQLSHKGSPRILEWVAYAFSSGSSQPRNRTRVSCIAGGFFLPDRRKAKMTVPPWRSLNILPNCTHIHFLGNLWMFLMSGYCVLGNSLWLVRTTTE